MAGASPPSANVITQVYPEAVAFTAGAATKILNGVYFTDEAKEDTYQFTPQGQQNPTESVRGKAWSELQVVADFPDFNGLTYIFASLLGLVAPTTHTGGVNSKDWGFIKSIVNAALGQTYTIERGTTVRARRYSGVIVDAFTLTGTQDKISVSGHAWGQKLQDAFTLTPALPYLSAIPLSGTNTTCYLDLTSANIGVTKLVPSQWSIAFSGFYTPWWGVDASAASYSDVIPLKPKIEIKLKVKANSTGMALYTYLDQGTTVYVRIDTTGQACDNIWLCTLGAPSAGTFTLTYNGVTTAGIAFNASAATVQTALTGLSTVGVGNAVVSGSAGGPYTITLLGPLLTSANLLTGSGAGLTGGAFSLVQTLINNELRIDAAAKISAPAPYGDDQGAEMIEFTGVVATDAAWGAAPGTALLARVTNNLTAL